MRPNYGPKVFRTVPINCDDKLLVVAIKEKNIMHHNMDWELKNPNDSGVFIKSIFFF